MFRILRARGLECITCWWGNGASKLLGSVLGVKIYEDSSVLGLYYGLYFLETSYFGLGV